jgi:hypothetical protein
MLESRQWDYSSTLPLFSCGGDCSTFPAHRRQRSTRSDQSPPAQDFPESGRSGRAVASPVTRALEWRGCEALARGNGQHRHDLDRVAREDREVGVLLEHAGSGFVRVGSHDGEGARFIADIG